MAWSRHGNRCKRCRTDRVKHHANGLCRSCYTRNRAQSVGRWPAYLSRCLMCSGHKSSTNYRSDGLCKRCHTLAGRAGVLVFWRIELQTKRSVDDSDALIVLRQIAKAVGSQQAAHLVGLPVSTFRSYAIGEQPIPNVVRDRAFGVWLDL